jgi:hypothetical protein
LNKNNLFDQIINDKRRSLSFRNKKVPLFLYRNNLSTGIAIISIVIDKTISSKNAEAMKTLLSMLGRKSMMNAARPRKESENSLKGDIKDGQLTKRELTKPRSRYLKDVQAFSYLLFNSG